MKRDLSDDVNPSRLVVPCTLSLRAHTAAFMFNHKRVAVGTPARDVLCPSGMGAGLLRLS